VESVEKVASDIAACLCYITHFCTRPSGVPGGAEGTGTPQATPPSLIAARETGVMPEAEYVPVEWTAESVGDQPPDVRAVLVRLIRLCDELACTPERAVAVGVYRRQHFPGVLERGRVAATTSTAMHRS
jgi:hypothetical protein